jgi:hypothetical protein
MCVCWGEGGKESFMYVHTYFWNTGWSFIQYTLASSSKPLDKGHIHKDIGS